MRGLTIGTAGAMVAAVIVAGMVVPPAVPAGQPPAQPEMVTVGSALVNLNEPGSCAAPSGCAGVHQKLPGQRVTAPWPGVIVRWRVLGQGNFELFTARYTDGAKDIVARGHGTIVRKASSLDSVSTFGARTRIGAGEYIGLAMPHRARFKAAENAGADLDSWEPAPAAFGNPARAALGDQKGEVGFNADIESDADGDGYGDVTQDKCPSERSTHDACEEPEPPEEPEEEPDTSAPTFVSGPSLKPRTPRARKGASLRFVLSEPASMTVTIERRRRGRPRYRRIARIARAVVEGPNTIPISGRRLRRGRYRLVLRMVDEAGNAAAPARLRFSAR